jgi:hypothetical protein
MKTKTKVIIVSIAVVTTGVGIYFADRWTTQVSSQGPYALKRSFPGRVWRRFHGGEGIYKQHVDDLADDLALPGVADTLRAWAEKALKTGFKGASTGEDVDVSSMPPPQLIADHSARWGYPPRIYFYQVDAENAQGGAMGIMIDWSSLRSAVLIVPHGISPHLDIATYGRAVAPDIRVFYMTD